jgi:hypothetical protein
MNVAGAVKRICWEERSVVDPANSVVSSGGNSLQEKYFFSSVGALFGKRPRFLT